MANHPGMGFPDTSVDKESAWNAGDPDSIPGSGRSPGEGIGYPLQYSWASFVAPACNAGDLGWREGKGYPLQYSGLENSMDCIVHRVTKSQTRQRLSLFFYSSILACKIPWTEESGRLQSIGHKSQTQLRD